MPSEQEINDPSLWNVRPSDYGPGKFEGETLITHHYYEQVMGGDGELLWSDEDGGGSATGFVLDPSDDYDARVILEAFGNPPVNDDPPFGVIVSEDSQGFVGIEICNERQYKALEKHLASRG